MILLAGPLLIGIWLAGCELLQNQRYHEKYEIRHLTVVLMDNESLQTEWRKISGKPSFQSVYLTVGQEQLQGLKVVRGFFDYKTNTIYCPKMDFEVCGHELFHSIIGRFHPEK